MVLSKSSFIRGRQCELSLFLNFNYKRLDIPRDEPDYSKFEAGYATGELAQSLFPGGIETGYVKSGRDYKAAIKNTAEALITGHYIIYEGAFVYDDCLSIMDIMVKNGRKWDLYEVKSSNSTKDYYYFDAAFQYYVIKNSGLPVNNIYIIHLNKEYERIGELELKKLFVTDDITDTVKKLQNDIKQLAQRYKSVIASKKYPVMTFGKQCKGEPANPCDFYTYCHRELPEYSVFNISRMSDKAYELYKMKIVNVMQIPDDFLLSDNQLIEVKCYKENKPYIQKDKIKGFIDEIKYPLYYMDFETYMKAIPEFDHTRPWQVIPFQFSVHIQKNKNSEPEHFSYLGDVHGDPRPEFIKQLIKVIGKKGSVLVYNKTFEESRLKELARDFPKYRNELESIIDRLTDLCVPFRQKFYYTPEMQSSASLKYVLPALCPDLSYDELEIGDGSTASDEFVRCRNITDKKEIDNIRESLLVYCELDTYGMVRILEELEKLIVK